MVEKFYKINKHWYSSAFNVDDEVVPVSNAYKDDRLKIGSTASLIIHNIRDGQDKWGSRTCHTMETSPSNYETVYDQDLTFVGIPGWYKAKNFIKKEENKMLAIGVDRPCAVWKLTETVGSDGIVTTTKSGEPQFFATLSAAQAWTQKLIQDEIRNSNVYPKYAIYEERYVAQAKEPPVVFE